MILTTQDIFDKVVIRMLKQGKRSQTEAGSCMYRKGDLCCAAGALIADEHYSPTFEGRNTTAIEVVTAIARSLGVANLEYRQLQLIEHCQKTHDNWDPEDWPERFRKIAGDFRLTMPEVVA